MKANRFIKLFFKNIKKIFKWCKIIKQQNNGRVAQGIEYVPSKHVVAGSNPATIAIFFIHFFKKIKNMYIIINAYN